MIAGLLLVAMLASPATAERKVVPAAAKESPAKPGATSPAPKTNDLATEKSLYLREHATNPVRWRPWGAAAFEAAKREGKPIFLSIGYASCHWCHVMERESFTNDKIAALINANFVPVLVDREEHPDVDATYIEFVQAMTGSAGWPANLVITPDLQPIVGASYLRPESLESLLSVIAARWRDERPALLASSDQLVSMVRNLAQPPAPVDAAISAKTLETAFEQIRDSYDAEHGGFGDAPRFPQPGTIDFLLRYAMRTGDARAREMALFTLERMADGAVHDQIGGGFHRYAVDAAWQVPHFEKMLSDQALIAIVFLEAWQMSGDDRFARVTRSTLDHALAEMRQAGGAFDSALDSDSMDNSRKHVIEGAYYVWELPEVVGLLGAETAAVVAFHYGLQAEGNVPAAFDPRGELKGKSVLAVRHSIAETAAQFELTAAEAEALLLRSGVAMREARSRRARPRRDDKVLTSWNGLMISALARAGAALEEPKYVDAATRAATALRATNYDPRGRRLLRTACAGDACKGALSEDYAHLIGGLLDLYESTFAVEWLDFAVVLQRRHDELFWRDKEQRYAAGGTVPSALAAVVRETDTTLPSHNSAAAMNLLRLADITDNQQWRERAASIFRSFAGPLQSSPADLPQMAAALSRQLSTTRQIVIAGEPGASDTRAMLRLVNRRFLPNRVLLLAPGGTAQEALARYAPFVEKMARIGNRATAYICEHYVCKMPTNDLSRVQKILEQ